MDLPFDFISKFLFSTKSIADLIFLLVTLVVTIVSVILFFHWRKYGLGGATFALIEVVYLVVCVMLLAIAFFSIN